LILRITNWGYYNVWIFKLSTGAKSHKEAVENNVPKDEERDDIDQMSN
jgi:hypothetical protein